MIVTPAQIIRAWKDVEQLHDMLGSALKNRHRFKVAISKAKKHESGKNPVEHAKPSP